MSFETTWFRCPNCFRPLSRVDELAIGCASGHRFDVSRQGTVTLLPPRTPKTIGDSREMLEARRDLLHSGMFAPIADAIVEASRNVVLEPSREQLRVADLGCGTGYYSARVADASPATTFLAADRSPVAVRMATREIPRSTGVVLDLWQPLPLRDDVADVVLNVFAPRHASEFARILSPRGRLIVVVPTARHLHELRAAGALIDIPQGKAERVIDQFVGVGLALLEQTPVEYTRSADAPMRAQLAGMGPSAHHAAALAATGASGGDGSGTPSPLTVSVDVLVFGRTAPSS